MPITSSVVAQISSEPGGLVRVREEHTDHTGKVWTPPSYKGVRGADHSLLLAAHAEKLLISIKRDERDALGQQLLDGVTTPETWTMVHITLAEMVRPILRAFMNMSPDVALTLARWVDADLTDDQIEQKTSVVVRQKVRARITNILSIQVALVDDANHIVEVDAS